MTNVVYLFDEPTETRTAADDILERCKGRFARVMVIGVTEHSVSMIHCMKDIPEAVFMLHSCLQNAFTDWDE